MAGEVEITQLRSAQPPTARSADARPWAAGHRHDFQAGGRARDARAGEKVAHLVSAEPAGKAVAGVRERGRADRPPFPVASPRRPASCAQRIVAGTLLPGQDLRARPGVRARGAGNKHKVGDQEAWPDPAAHENAEAARAAHEEVDAVRAVPHPHSAREPGGPEPIRGRRRGYAGGAAVARARDAQAGGGEDPRAGELERKNLVVSAHAFSATAREAIEGAGGTCTLVELTRRATA